MGSIDYKSSSYESYIFKNSYFILNCGVPMFLKSPFTMFKSSF